MILDVVRCRRILGLLAAAVLVALAMATAAVAANATSAADSAWLSAAILQ